MDREPFNILALPDWLRVARAAGVASVPAVEVARAPVWALERFDEFEAEDVAAALRPFFDVVNRSVHDHPGHVHRWDFCAPSDLKSAMSSGRTNDRMFHVTPDDPRFYDIMSMDWDRPHVGVHRRPWVRARTVDGWPEEYRAFVEDGKVVGISSYYPQRPLEATRERLATVEEVRRLASAMIPHVPWPLDMAGRLTSKVGDVGVSCTLDFILTEEGSLLLIEGGPPIRPTWGASPCCFADDDVAGVALAAVPGSSAERHNAERLEREAELVAIMASLADPKAPAP